MLRHIGAKRNFQHNVRLAVLLCLDAGFVNAAGFLGFRVLTTNVTGHAALLALNVASNQWRAARMVALWLLLFLGGAFISSVYINKIGREKAFAYTTPLLFIMMVLSGVAIFGHTYTGSLPQTEFFAGSLLFVMGMQNALVSVISGSVVRTTHLTGMVTDLGIDLATAVVSFNKILPTLKRRIILRLVIILSFLAGAVIGGLLFVRFSFHSFFIPVAILTVALFYDYLRIKVTRVIVKGKNKIGLK